MTIHAPLRAYSIKSAAELLDRKPSILYKMIERGEVKCFRIGLGTQRNKGLRITAEELAKLMQPGSRVIGEETGPSGAAEKPTSLSTEEKALLRASMARDIV